MSGTDRIETLREKARDATLPVELKWRPIEEFEELPYAGHTPMTLLGWWSPGGGGYPSGIHHVEIGWLDHSGLWVDASDKKPWPRLKAPTHFAIRDCRQIPTAENAPAAAWGLG